MVMIEVGMGCSPQWLCSGISYGFGLLGLALVAGLVWAIWRSR